MQPRLVRVRPCDALVTRRVGLVQREDVRVARLRLLLFLLSLRLHLVVRRPGEAEALADERAVGEALQAEDALDGVDDRGGAGALFWGGLGGGFVLRGEDAALPPLDAPEAEEGGEEDEPA